jgi:hypothetical protein
MSDDKKKVGKPDRDRVSGTESYEVDRLVKKFELPAPLVKQEGDRAGRADAQRCGEVPGEVAGPKAADLTVAIAARRSAERMQALSFVGGVAPWHA